MPETIMEEGRNLAAPDPAEQASTDVLLALLQHGASLAAPGFLGSRKEIEQELDEIAAAMRIFHLKPADKVMRECSAITARLTELAVLLHRNESLDRQYTRVRTQQVDRFLAEADRQWKTASRLIEVQRQDLSVLGGQV